MGWVPADNEVFSSQMSDLTAFWRFGLGDINTVDKFRISAVTFPRLHILTGFTSIKNPFVMNSTRNMVSCI